MYRDTDFIAHFKNLTENQQQQQVEKLFLAHKDMLFEAEAVLDEIDGLEFSHLWLDGFEILSIYIKRPTEIRVGISFTLNGEVKGYAYAIIDGDGCFRYTHITAKRELGDENDDNVDENIQFDDPLKHWHGIKEVSCPKCKKRFERDYEKYPFNVCPRCREREVADRKRELAKLEIERAKGGLVLCKVCQNFFRSSLTEIAPKICPECQRRGANETSRLQNDDQRIK